MAQKKRGRKRSGAAAHGGGLDTRIGGSTTPDFTHSPDTDIGHAGLEAYNAQAGIADDHNRAGVGTPKKSTS